MSRGRSKEIDLFQVNRAAFGRVSFSLQHLLEQLGHAGKSGHYDSAVAERACAGSEKDQRALKRYNNGDTRGTEWAYDQLRGAIPNHPFMGVADGLSCNQCGALEDELEPVGEYTAQVLVYPLYECSRCGGHVKDRKSIGRVGFTAGVR